MHHSALRSQITVMNQGPAAHPRGCSPEHRGKQYFLTGDIWSAVTQPLCFTPRKDPCALCCRGEQVSHLGPRLPHDPPPHAPCRSHKDGQGPPWYHPQPGFLAPAGRPGQCPEAEEEFLKQEERGVMWWEHRVWSPPRPRCPLSGRDRAFLSVRMLGS